MERGLCQKIGGPELCGPGLMWQLRGNNRRWNSFHLPAHHPLHVGLCHHAVPHSGIMAAVPPDLTSVFQAGRMVDDMEEKKKGSLLARICLLEVRG